MTQGVCTKKSIKGKRSKNKSTKRRGGCGCSGKVGGKRLKRTASNRKKRNMTRRIKGGSENLAQLPIRYYYENNTHTMDPNNPSFIGNSIKSISTGGKRKKSNRRRVKGGLSLNDIFLGNSSRVDLNTGFGTTIGAKSIYDISTFGQSTNPDTTIQPASNLNNEHTPLLV
jgi:hypothetical protein